MRIQSNTHYVPLTSIEMAVGIRSSILYGEFLYLRWDREVFPHGKLFLRRINGEGDEKAFSIPFHVKIC
jgi:hypothetical protein